MLRCWSTHTLVAGAVLAVATAAAPAADLVNGGFEWSGPAWGRSLLAEWGGDPVAFVGPTDGIVPMEGSRMAQFIATSNRDDERGNIAADLLQLVDLSDLRDEIRSGQVTLDVIGWVNRVAGDRETDSLFAVSVQAFSGDRGGYLLSPQSHLARATSRLVSDDRPETWEPVYTSLCLPVQTDFVVVRVHANENVANDLRDGELDGHFADWIQISANVRDTCVSPADVNEDGMVDLDDLFRVADRLGKRGAGDVDRDGQIWIEDLLEVVMALD
ncbi:MAG: hypothetical protein ACYTG3_21465 [Planctomycetota bacterium]|jgi:hypothetical protein